MTSINQQSSGVQESEQRRMEAENALRESEELHRLVLTNISDAVFITDNEGVFTFICPNVDVIFSYSLAEVRALTNIENLLGKGLFNLKDLNEKGEIPNIECEIKAKHGETRHLLVNVKRINIRPNGTVLYSCRDISDRKHAEGELRESEAQIRMIFEHALDAIVVIDGKDRIREWSPQAEAIFGWPKSEVIGQALANTIIPPRFHQAHHQGLKYFLKTGKGKILDKRVELTALHRNGSEFPIELTVSPLRLGESWIFSAFIRDITERRRVEEERRLLTRSIESAGDSIVITDSDATIQYVNPAFTTLTGYSPEEAVGHKPSLSSSRQQSPEFYKKMWDSILSGKVWTGQVVNKKKDGTLYDVELTIAPVFNETGEREGFVGLQKDITERKQAEREIRQLNEELEKRVIERTAELQDSLEKLKEDEEAGKVVQSKLLPKELKTIGNFEFSHYLLPSMYLSGDFVDYFQIDNRYIGFYMADVSGHGAPSAFVTVFLKSFMTHCLENYKSGREQIILDPAKILKKLNTELIRDNLEKHLTMFYAIIDGLENRLIFVNAGQFPQPVYKGTGQVEFVKCNGTPPGLFEFSSYANVSRELPEKFLFLIVSDGILEVLPQKDLSEKQSFLASLAKGSSTDIPQIVSKLRLDEIEHFPDDITFLMVKGRSLNERG